MTDGVTIDIDDREVLRALRQARESGLDLRPAMSDVAGILEDAIDRAFVQERDPATGRAWAPLSATTRARRRGSVFRILQDSGSLVNSVRSEYDDDSAVAGLAERYASTHHFGARKGQFGRTRPGAPIPWGDIPARPIVGISDDDEAEILQILSDHIMGGFAGSSG